MSDEIEEPTCDFDSCCPHYPHIIKLLKRERKCVELAVEALDKLLKKVRQYAEAGCIEAMNPDRDYENGLGAEEDRAIEALTKIKSLREGEIK